MLTDNNLALILDKDQDHKFNSLEYMIPKIINIKQLESSCTYRVGTGLSCPPITRMRAITSLDYQSAVTFLMVGTQCAR
jgi:hypothetical protein